MRTEAKRISSRRRGFDSGKRYERKREGGVEESKQGAVSIFGKRRQIGHVDVTWLSPVLKDDRTIRATVYWAILAPNNLPHMEHIADPRVSNFSIGRHYQLLDVIGEGAYGIVW